VNGGGAARRGESVQPDYPRVASEAVEQSAMKIELLGFGGCANTPRMRANIVAALAQFGHVPLLTEVDQDALPDGDARRGYPAPTLLVNGRDLYGLPVPTRPAKGCRLYPDGVPAREQLVARLAAALSAEGTGPEA
jgi:hypothetical protein